MNEQPLTEMLRKAVAAERAAILAYLRARPFLTVVEVVDVDAIAAGAHLSPAALTRKEPYG